MPALLDAPLPRPAPRDAGPVDVPVVLLAAGKGSRLRPVTDQLAKPLVPILNVPLLFWLVQGLHALGARTLVANTCHLSEQLADAARRLRDRDGIELALVREERPSGPAGGLAACRAALPEADCSLVVSADAWADFDVAALVADHRASGADLTIGATTVPDPHRFGVLDLGAGTEVVGLRGKSLAVPPDALVSCGIYVIGERVLPLLDPQGGGEYDFKDLVPQLLSRAMTVRAHVLRGSWNDVGDVDAYLDVNLGALDPETASRVAEAVAPHVWVQPGASLHADVTVTGPVLVGPGAVVESGAVLGHAVVGAAVRVPAGASVIRSVILPGAAVPADRPVKHEVLA